MWLWHYDWLTWHRNRSKLWHRTYPHRNCGASVCRLLEPYKILCYLTHDPSAISPCRVSYAIPVGNCDEMSNRDRDSVGAQIVKHININWSTLILWEEVRLNSTHTASCRLFYVLVESSGLYIHIYVLVIIHELLDVLINTLILIRPAKFWYPRSVLLEEGLCYHFLSSISRRRG